MQFVVIGRDGTDPDAGLRRLAARPDHLALGDQMIADGSLVCATALLDDDGQMIGSVMIVDFPSRADVDAYLRREPYVVGDVWRRVEVMPARLGPSFAHLAKASA